MNSFEMQCVVESSADFNRGGAKQGRWSKQIRKEIRKSAGLSQCFQLSDLLPVRVFIHRGQLEKLDK
jgi:hypothetical protein